MLYLWVSIVVVMNRDIFQLKSEVLAELQHNILPFWMERMCDNEHGGFIGAIDGNGNVRKNEPKGAILNARILWTFAAAYRLLGNPRYLEIADRAKNEITGRFRDSQFGGIYWSLDSKGLPLDTKKQFYALGFAVYGLSEYYRATGDDEALTMAKALFRDIEDHSFDRLKNGYIEACTRDWQEIADMRLSDKDANERKTMNTHLHILEGYTALYRVWKDAELAEALRNLIAIFTDKITDRATGHLQLFFDDDWNSRSAMVSYGHDIEASWLLSEAAEVLGDETVIEKTTAVCARIAAAAAEGFLPHNGMIYEADCASGSVDADRHWWVQAETVVGFFNQYTQWGDETSLQKALDCWEFIKAHIIDRQNGEWLWSLRADGSQNRTDDKAGFWKCPYHNGRMCLELADRIFCNF